jgi:hypothetical protein
VSSPRSFWDLLRNSGGVFESTISGTSMEPTLSHGARVRIRPLAQHKYHVGQIVACVLKDELFAHRIVFCEPQVIVTQGDNHVLCDPPTPKREILGVVDEYLSGDVWKAPGAAPPPRFPGIAAANLRMVRACLHVHFQLGRRAAGTTLHVGRFLGMAISVARHRSAPKA